MPIRRELRQYYGAAHRRRRAQLIAASGGDDARCSNCGDTHPRLNMAHVNHDPRELTPVELWCPRCHATHDAAHSYAVRRRTRAQSVGQQWILPEVEFAPFAPWMIPPYAIHAALQGRLFA